MFPAASGSLPFRQRPAARTRRPGSARSSRQARNSPAAAARDAPPWCCARRRARARTCRAARREHGPCDARGERPPEHTAARTDHHRSHMCPPASVAGTRHPSACWPASRHHQRAQPRTQARSSSRHSPCTRIRSHTPACQNARARRITIPGPTTSPIPHDGSREVSASVSFDMWQTTGTVVTHFAAPTHQRCQAHREPPDSIPL